MREPEMALLAGWIDRVVEATGRDDEAVIRSIGGEVRALTAGFPIPGAVL